MIQMHNEKVAYQQGFEDGVREERQRILDAVYASGWNCEVNSREALDEMVSEQLKEHKNG